MRRGKTDIKQGMRGTYGKGAANLYLKACSSHPKMRVQELTGGNHQAGYWDEIGIHQQQFVIYPELKGR